MTLLEEFGISQNKLTALPESIGNLTFLQELNVTFNELTNLPESIGELSSLRWLDLQGNQLSVLPASIANISDTLEILFVNQNQIPANRREAIEAMLQKTRIHW